MNIHIHSPEAFAALLLPGYTSLRILLNGISLTLTRVSYIPNSLTYHFHLKQGLEVFLPPNYQTSLSTFIFLIQPGCHVALLASAPHSMAGRHIG